MKVIRPLAVLLILGFSYDLLFGQDSLLLELNQQRTGLNKKAMWVLGSWAVGNIVVGGIASRNTSGTTRYFHEGNALWNTVNLGLAGFGLWQAYTTDPTSLSAFESFKEQQSIEKILLFNAALDLGYMTGGAYLIERSKNTSDRPERLKGWGRALILQGGFLLLFDATVYYLHHKQGMNKLQPVFENLSLNIDGNGLGVLLRF
ncbi:MAG: hypothetical protein AAGI38_22925 [Bacteroidota bacterium]